MQRDRYLMMHDETNNSTIGQKMVRILLGAFIFFAGIGHLTFSKAGISDTSALISADEPRHGCRFVWYYRSITGSFSDTIGKKKNSNRLDRSCFFYI